MKNFNIIKNVVSNLDRAFAILGIFLGVLLFFISIFRNPLYVVVGSILFFSCVIYLHISKNIRPQLLSVYHLQTRRSVYLLLNVFFFFTLSFSLMSFYFRVDPYVRPFSYFISIILLVCLLSVEILFLSRSEVYEVFVLLKIIMIPLSLVFSQLLIFPSLIGEDPLQHFEITTRILDSGFLQKSGSYSKLPVFHLIVSETSLMTGMDYRLATMFSISFTQIVCILLFVFLFGKFLFNVKVGLFAALLLGVSNYVIHMSFLTIPNTLAVVQVLIILYIILIIKQKNSFIISSLSLLFMFLLILTHTLVAAIMAILLFTLYSGSKVFEMINNKNYKNTPTFGTFLFFTITTLSWWVYASGHLVNLAAMLRWGFKIDAFSKGIRIYGPGITKYYISFFELLLNNVGVYLFSGISLIGAFYMISKDVNSLESFNLSLGGFMILVVTFMGIIFRRGVLMYRWHYMSQVLLSIPLALSLLLLASRFNKDSTRVFFIIFTLCIFSFFMIMSSSANVDNPAVRRIAVRSSLTVSELKAMDILVIDQNKQKENDVSDCLTLKDFSDCNFPFVIKKEFLQSTVGFDGRYISKLTYDPEKFLTEEGFSNFYDSGSVGGFYHT